MFLFDKLRRALKLSLTDWLYFFEAWFWLLVFDLGLRTRPFSNLQAYAARFSAHPTLSPEQTRQLIRMLKEAVDRARWNHIYQMTCLRRSLTLQKMLAERGIAVELKIGVRKDAGQLSAHAWLEYQGKPLGESERIVEKFAELMKTSPNTGK